MFFLAIIFFIFTGSFSAFPQTLGDADNNGAVDIIDALVTAQYYVGMNPLSFNSTQSDVNADGLVDIIDALLISQYYVGIITEFPGGGSTNSPAGTPDPSAGGTVYDMTAAMMETEPMDTIPNQL